MACHLIRMDFAHGDVLARDSCVDFTLHSEVYNKSWFLIVTVIAGTEPTTKPVENALDVLKVGFSIGRAHRAIAICDERRSHSYGELLHSSFQLSLLLQSLLSEERQLPIANTSMEAHGGGVNEIQQEGSKTGGNFISELTETCAVALTY